MEYSKLVAVSGIPGLFELINSKTDGGIVRSLDDNTTKFVSSRIHQFSHLESIEVYTVGDNVNLVDILNAMGNATEKLPDEKDPAAVRKYFEKVYSDLDFDRVYASDLKKMVKWFAVLKKHNVEIKLSEPPEEEIVEEAPAPEEKPAPKEKAKPEKKQKQKQKEEEPTSKKKETEKEPVKKKSAGKKK